MKKALLTFAITAAATIAAQAANIRVVNYTDDLASFVPIATSTGELLPANSGTVQIGYFNTLTDATIPGASLDAIVADFVAFGASNVIGDLAQGAFDTEKSLSTAEGSPFIGKSIYVLIGSGNTLATSAYYGIAKDNDTIPQDNPASEALVNLTEAANTTWLVGSLGESKAINDGIFSGNFATLNLAPSEVIPEPGSALLMLSAVGMMVRRRRSS